MSAHTIRSLPSRNRESPRAPCRDHDRTKPAAPVRSHRPRDWSGRERQHGRTSGAGHGSSGEGHRRECRSRRKSRRATTKIQGGEEETVGRKIGGHEGWLMTPLGLMSQPTQCPHIGLAGGSAPSTPAQRYGARCAGADPPSMRGRRVACRRDDERRAILRRPGAHGRPRPPRRYAPPPFRPYG